MRVAAYCRVSTNSSDQANSLENQVSYFSREIEAKGHELINVYADRGLSGTNLDRPQFEKMLYDAGIDIEKFNKRNDARIKARRVFYAISDREPEFDEIWFKNTSRFARNTLSSEIVDKLNSKGVHLFFVEQNINTGDATKGFQLKLFQLFDEQDSKDRSLKTSFGRKEAVKKGKILTNGKLFGYNYDSKCNTLKINDEEAKIVKLIFDLYEKGNGTRKIMNHLRDNGMKTRNGSPFGYTTIRRIIGNEKYMGMNNPFKYDVGKAFDRSYGVRINKEYEVVSSDRIDPIITEQQFLKCQKKLKDSVNYQKSVGKYRGYTKYNSLIYCGSCDSVYYSNPDNGIRRYVCSKKKKFGVKACSEANIKQQTIDDKVQELLNGEYKRLMKIQYDRLKGTLARKLNETVDALKVMDSTLLNKAEQDLKKLETERKNLINLYASNANDEMILKAINDRKVQIDKQQM